MKAFILQGNGLLGVGIKGAFLVDIAVVILFFVMALAGARKGAIRAIIGLIATVVALVVAFRYSDELAEVLDGSLTKWLGGKLETAFLKIKGFQLDVSAVGLEESLSKVSLPSFVKDFIIEEFGNADLPYGTTLAMLAGDAVASLIVKVVSWFILFFGAKIVLSIISRLLTRIADNVAVVGGINVLFGAVVGTIKAFVLVCGILAVLSILPLDSLTTFFNETLFVGYLYNENPLIKLLLN